MTFEDGAIVDEDGPAVEGLDPGRPDGEPSEAAELAGTAATSGSVSAADVPPRGPSAGERAARRASDLRLARLHLRLGAFILARAELEAANEDRPLSDGSLLDLAEVRLRTGDLAGAGRAAEASLAEGGEALLATVIAAEAALVDGRPSDASDWAARTLEQAGPELDDALLAVFAGMPRSALWPADPLEAALSGSTPAGRAPGRQGGSAGLAGLPRTRLETPRPAASAGSTRRGASGERPDADPVAELAAAEADLESGDVTAAAIRLGVVLRLAPALAPAALELLEHAPGPLAALIRGDAYRLVGREAEAEQAYAEATQAIAADVSDATADSSRQATLEDSP